MRPLVISSCKLMKFEVLLQRREDAANDARKTGGRYRVADDQNAMQALVFNPAAEIRCQLSRSGTFGFEARILIREAITTLDNTR